MLKVFYFLLRYFYEKMLYHLANTCTNWNRFGVFLRWNRWLLTRYLHGNGHFCWFYFNMDKPTPLNNYLKIHYCPIHQIDIPPAQILSSSLPEACCPPSIMMSQDGPAKAAPPLCTLNTPRGVMLRSHEAFQASQCTHLGRATMR